MMVVDDVSMTWMYRGYVAGKFGSFGWPNGPNPGDTCHHSGQEQ